MWTRYAYYFTHIHIYYLTYLYMRARACVCVLYIYYIVHGWYAYVKGGPRRFLRRPRRDLSRVYSVAGPRGTRKLSAGQDRVRPRERRKRFRDRYPRGGPRKTPPGPRRIRSYVAAERSDAGGRLKLGSSYGPCIFSKKKSRRPGFLFFTPPVHSKSLTNSRRT